MGGGVGAPPTKLGGCGGLGRFALVTVKRAACFSFRGESWEMKGGELASHRGSA